MPPSEANYDETKVPLYSLPDPLTLASGEPVADAAVWTEVRRPEILQLFKNARLRRDAWASARHPFRYHRRGRGHFQAVL